MKDDKFDFYKEFYFFEHNRKNSFASAHSLSIGILSILVGAIVFYLNDGLPKIDSTLPCLPILFYLLLILTLINIIWAFKTLLKSFAGNPYDYLADMDLIHAFEKDNANYLKDNPQLADEEFFNNLKASLAAAASKNHKVNTARASAMVKVNRSLIGATISLALSAIPYFFQKNLHAEKETIQQVKIVNFNDILNSNNFKKYIAMPEENNKGTGGGNDSPKDSTEPIKPTFPSNVTIVEGNDPYKGDSLNETSKPSPTTEKKSNNK